MLYINQRLCPRPPRGPQVAARLKAPWLTRQSARLQDGERLRKAYIQGGRASATTAKCCTPTHLLSESGHRLA